MSVRLRMMLECSPGLAKRAGMVASGIATYKNPPTEAEPRHYTRKGVTYLAWIAADGVIWVRQETEPPVGGTDCGTATKDRSPTA